MHRSYKNLRKDLIIKRSKIEKRGVFAGRDFKKGEIVFDWKSPKQITKEKAKDVSKKAGNDAYINGKYFLVPYPGNHINHSCSPNTYFNNFEDIAKRRIKKGEEINSDYSELMKIGDSMTCHCGSKNCRRIIKGKKK